ncbi:MAG: hypothetical protein ACK55Z_19605, partial [bacterium]
MRYCRPFDVSSKSSHNRIVTCSSSSRRNNKATTQSGLGSSRLYLLFVLPATPVVTLAGRKRSAWAEAAW